MSFLATSFGTATESLPTVSVPSSSQKALTRRGVDSVPEGTDNIWAFRIAVLEGDENFVAFLGHKHEATTTAGVWCRHSRPGCRRAFHPVVLNLNAAHAAWVVVVYNSRR